MEGRIRADWDRLDDCFAVSGDAYLERIYADGRWVEGPAYSPARRCLLFSDIPNDRVLRWDETTGAVGVFAQPCGNANGRAIDRRGSGDHASTAGGASPASSTTAPRRCWPIASRARG